MKNSPDISQLGVILGRFFRRYHVILFTLTVVAGVSAALLLLNGLLVASSAADDGVVQQQRFDQETIKKIDSFGSRTTTSRELQFPGGRTSPFVE
ncbi:MAG: hypothetical protein Q4F02_04195 [Candidatus Saccharibacteria bacterium]|nr:hypothetical protein [Candidatus Saccharibacteria bacterium]